MKTPYEILGIGENATEQEVQAAYQRIVNQYSPENHPDNPLAHLAQEKINEAESAYRQIIDERNRPKQDPSAFLDIRRLINNNRISEAEELLEGVPFERRDAEWYFLKGSVQYSRGWLEDAYENFTRASQMNPQNAEYRAALNQLQWQRQTGGATPGQPIGTGGTMVRCGVCDICASMMCANICCNCMSGC